jgi:hypothetical protein
VAEEQTGSDFVLTIGKDGRRYDDLITRNSADWMTARIDLRGDVLYDRPPSTIVGRQWHEGPQQKTLTPVMGRTLELANVLTPSPPMHQQYLSTKMQGEEDGVSFARSKCVSSTTSFEASPKWSRDLGRALKRK